MVFPMILLKIAAQWPLSCYRAARKLRGHGILQKNQPRSSNIHLQSTYPSVAKCSLQGRESHTTLVSDFCSSLLTPTSTTPFPYFMLVAFEGGSLLRSLLLLSSSPLLWLVGYNTELSLRIMVFITFCGLRVKDMELVARAVLPKFYLDNMHLESYEAVMACKGRRVVFSSLPTVMVLGFLKEYLSVDVVVGTELKVTKGGYYFTGLLFSSLELKKQKALKEILGDHTKGDVGLVSNYSMDHLFLSHCKEVYIVNKQEDRASSCTSVLPREKYPKPLIFHDSRLAFLPTPLSTFALFLFLPLAIPLSVARILLGVLPPYKLILFFGALTGTRFRVHNLSQTQTKPNATSSSKGKGVLYVCTHRTLLDPVMLALALQRPIPAVTYSLSPVSEALAPMRTIRLTRNREVDAQTMSTMLKQGDLTICPEGTTCREPYLLRFSPLFAEIAEDIVPAAMEAEGSWFYGTTASGLKVLDPLFFLMNPTPAYRVRLLERVPREMTCAGGWSGSDVANRIQRRLGYALGFECTGLTRKDKYMMLAGNEGVVKKEQRGLINVN